MRRLRSGTAAAVLAVTCAAGTTTAVAEVDVTREDQPLVAAGHAAQKVSFVGVVQVQWVAAGTRQTETLLVQGANGSVVVRGSSSVMALPQQRLVEHDGGVWDLLWPAAPKEPGRPDVSRKYSLQPGPGAQVAGRPSDVVDVRHDGSLRERLFLDHETRLLLRREQFEAGPEPFRTVGFESITLGSPAALPKAPKRVMNATAKVVATGHVSRRVSAPPSLADGYQRLGIYRRPGVTHVRYSDGLYDLSVFQQEGRLDRRELPKGERVALRDGSGLHYVWPGGHLVLWGSGTTVYTAVSDAPLDQVLAAINSLPPVSAAPSLLRRLRQACRALVQPLAD